MRNKLLDSYKIDIAAKKYRKSAEKQKEVDREKEDLQGSGMF